MESNKRLKRIAKYLATQGLYKEAAGLEEMGEPSRPTCDLHPEEKLEPEKKGWYCEECGYNVLNYKRFPRPAPRPSHHSIKDYTVRPAAFRTPEAFQKWFEKILNLADGADPKTVEMSDGEMASVVYPGWIQDDFKTLLIKQNEKMAREPSALQEDSERAREILSTVRF